MLTDIYRIGIKKDGKTIYHHVKNLEALLLLLAEEADKAERVTITKQKLFSLDEDEKDC